MARQVVEGVIAGEGAPSEVVAKRGIKVVNDDGALMAAIEKVTANPALHTGDLGGKATTDQVTQAVCKELT